MTVRDAFEATLIELSKVQAPTLKVFEFNHYLNKAITLYVNKVYNIYDINQQTTDDLRVLVKTASLTQGGENHQFAMPKDYLHLLNCICLFKITKQKQCLKPDLIILVPATRLTADSWGPIIMDVYNRPSIKKPYYHIINTQTEEVPNVIKLNLTEKKPECVCEIRFGESTYADLEKIEIDYIKCPKLMQLTQELIDLIMDTSELMEFPDYVNQEIINELVHLIMEHDNNPRLGNNMLITQSIARPTGQLQTK